MYQTPGTTATILCKIIMRYCWLRNDKIWITILLTLQTSYCIDFWCIELDKPVHKHKHFTWWLNNLNCGNHVSGILNCKKGQVIGKWKNWLKSDWRYNVSRLLCNSLCCYWLLIRGATCTKMIIENMHIATRQIATFQIATFRWYYPHTWLYD